MERPVLDPAGGQGLRPASARELVRVQETLAGLKPAACIPEGHDTSVAGCFAAFPRGLSGRGSQGDAGVAAAVSLRGGRVVGSAVISGAAGAPYDSGLLFLRSGALLEKSVLGLPELPGVLLVNATGRDHPHRAGLALHLGALLGVPTVGVTHRTLCSQGPWPAGPRGSTSPFTLDGEVVGFWIRTRLGARPVAAHAAWRTGPETAAAVVLDATARARTPEPLRLARREARHARTPLS